MIPEIPKSVPLTVKPKEKESIDKIKDEFNKKLNPINFKIANAENRKSGNILIQSEN